MARRGSTSFGRERWARASLVLAVILFLGAVPASPVAAFLLLDEPPASRMHMTLGLGTTAFTSLDGERTTFNAVAARAMAVWNAIGVGPFLDHEFFSWQETPPRSSCRADGVNAVVFSFTNCGMAWGDTLGVTQRWIVDGKTIQDDVLFNGGADWDVYAGPIRSGPLGTIYDFQRVAIHEFGHVAGLDHVPNSIPSIMHARVDDVDRPQPDDIAGVHAVPFSALSPAALISVNPLAADFGVVGIGSSADRIFTVQNLGNSTLVGSVTGAGPFVCVAGCQYTLTVGATATVVIRFVPSLIGSLGYAVSFSGGGGVLRAVSGVGARDSFEAFVLTLFATALARPPAADELAAWSGYLRANPNIFAASAMIHAFFDGPEFHARPITVWTHATMLFRAILGRDPSGDELSAWASALVDRYGTLVTAFLGFTEFTQQLGNLRDPVRAQAVLSRFFQQIVGRAPSPAEITSWVAVLVATGSPDAAARALFGSIEYLAIPRTPAQHALVLFRALLARDPSPAELAYWADALGRLAIPIEDRFILSDEFGVRLPTLVR